MTPQYDSASGLFARDQLAVIDPSGRKMLYEMRGVRVSLGRSAENTIPLESSHISRNHLQLRKTQTGWEIIDSGGANGTTIGGRRLRPHHARNLRALEQVVVGGEFTLYWQHIDQPQPHAQSAAPARSFGAWYLTSAFVTLAILAVGIWLVLGILPANGIELLVNDGDSAESAWTGEWETNCEWLPCGRVELLQTEDGVTGHYLNNTGTLHGVVEDNQLIGIWLLGGASGTFEFTLSEQTNTFTGSWDDQWQWCGAPTGTPLNAECTTLTNNS